MLPRLALMDTTSTHVTSLPPLSEGNRLQRAYARWAAPHYAKLPQPLRAEVEHLDRWIYSSKALGAWLGLACAALATAAGLRMGGLSLPLATVCSLLLWVTLPVCLLQGWLQPEKYRGRRPLIVAAVSLGLVYLGMVSGFVVALLIGEGSLGQGGLIALLRAELSTAALLVGTAVLAMVTLSWAMAQIRRVRSERELAELRLKNERDSAARQVSEAKLQLLQAQIQPHFIFNTLAAVQHWVDTTDPRAGPLLRALTSFLRGSTEMLAREEVRIEEEAALAGQYLAVLQARLGERLRYTLDIAPAVAARSLPPGLLLCLVENAVEHGIAPAVAGGTIQVRGEATATGFRLCVLDDGAGLAPGWQEGIGLANCRQRLAHRFGERAVLKVQSQASASSSTLACIEVQT